MLPVSKQSQPLMVIKLMQCRRVYIGIVVYIANIVLSEVVVIVCILRSKYCTFLRVHAWQGYKHIEHSAE